MSSNCVGRKESNYGRSNHRQGRICSFLPPWATDWCKKMRKDSIEAFSHVHGLEVVAPQPVPEGESPDPEQGRTSHGLIQTLDEAEGIADYFVKEKVDALILGCLDFGDKRSAAKVAEKLRLPVLLYATKEPSEVYEPSLIRVSDSYCGNLSMASGLYRRKIPFHYGGLFLPEEGAFGEALKTFIRAVAVVKGLRGARIGQFGVRPAAFETVGCNEAAMIAKFGQNIIPENLADIVNTAKSKADDDDAVQEILADIRSGYPVITVNEQHLLNAAKLEAAMVDFSTQHTLSGIAMSCWPTIRSSIGAVCNTFGRLTDKGIMTACETDVLGVLAMITSYQAAMGETVPHFVDWTIQHRENPDLLLAWHCGNAPASLAANRAEVALRSGSDMKGELGISDDFDSSAGQAQFQLKPGKVTFCRLAEYDNEWKMLITTGEVVPSDEVMGGTWAWVKVRDHDRLYRTLVEEGFIHHASMAYGDQIQALAMACKFLDVETVVV